MYVLVGGRVHFRPFWFGPSMEREGIRRWERPGVHRIQVHREGDAEPVVTCHVQVRLDKARVRWQPHEAPLSPEMRFGAPVPQGAKRTSLKTGPNIFPEVRPEVHTRTSAAVRFRSFSEAAKKSPTRPGKSPTLCVPTRKKSPTRPEQVPNKVCSRGRGSVRFRVFSRRRRNFWHKMRQCRFSPLFGMVCVELGFRRMS